MTSRLWVFLGAGQPVNVGRFSFLRIPRLSRHFFGMETPTALYAGTGVVLGALALMLVNLRRWYKGRRRPEDGHDRAERRELEWYSNPGRKKDIEKIPVENSLSEGKSLHEGLSRRVEQPEWHPENGCRPPG
jgi:hypothetical protein